jgi:hypothetical protein
MNTVTYRGKQYPVREVNGFLFATEDLEEVLFDVDFQPMDVEAERLAETILNFFSYTAYETLTDDDIVKRYLPETVEAVIPGYVDGYSAFLMVNLAKQFGLIKFELEYDLQWEEGIRLYHEFRASGLDDERMSEHDAIVNFLKYRNETEDKG